jgi:hypothetical protein
VLEVIKLMEDRGISRTRRMYTLINADKQLSDGLRSNLAIQLTLSNTSSASDGAVDHDVPRTK